LPGKCRIHVQENDAALAGLDRRIELLVALPLVPGGKIQDGQRQRIATASWTRPPAC
jgi:hypothetical protein